MREIKTAIPIHAPDIVVARILADFSAYPEWNPFITGIRGVPEIGETLSVTLRLPGDTVLTMSPRIIVANDLELAWLGHLWIQGLFDGEHHFVIQSEDRLSCTFIQYEQFRGILMPFTGRLLVRTRQGFEAMNRALKERAERIHDSSDLH